MDAQYLLRNPHPTLRSLAEAVLDGSIQVPHFQRPYVWRAEQKRQFFRSLLDECPTGSLLVWHWKSSRGFTRPLDIGDDDAFDGRESAKLAIIDGQQRLTTLAQQYYLSTIDLKDWRRLDSRSVRVLMIDCSTADFARGLSWRAPDKVAREGSYVLKGSTVALPGLLRDDWEDLVRSKVGAERSKERLRRIREALVSRCMPVERIPDDVDIDRVVEIFKRINFGGKKLGVIDIVAASVFNAYKKLNKQMREFHREIVYQGGTEGRFGAITRDALLMSLLQRVARRANPSELAKQRSPRGGSGDKSEARPVFEEQRVREEWERVQAQYRLLVSFITENLHLDSTRCLETLYLVVAAEVLGRHDSAETRSKLAAWLIRAHCHLPYTGGSTTKKLQADLDTVRAGGEAMWRALFDSTRREATQNRSSDTPRFQASWFRKRSSSSKPAAHGVDSLVAHVAWLAAHDLGAVDWCSGSALPKVRPASAGRKAEWVNVQLFDSADLGGREEVKRVGNRVYLERRQGAALLAEEGASSFIRHVLRSRSGAEALEAQCIPVQDLGLLDDPVSFVERREQLLAEKIESMLQRLERGENLRYLRPSIPLSLPAADLLAEARGRSGGRARESTHLEFKATFAFDHPAYNEWGLGKDIVAKTVAALANSGGGVLLIGVDDDGKVIGIEREEEAYRALCEAKGKNCIEFERRIREHVVRQTYPRDRRGFGDPSLLEVSLEHADGRSVAVVRVRGGRHFIWCKTLPGKSPVGWMLLERVGASSIKLDVPAGCDLDAVIEELAPTEEPKLPVRSRFAVSPK